MTSCYRRPRFAACAIAALFLLTFTSSLAPAATSLSNSLTGFTGNSTQGATQTALAGVGLGFTSTSGAAEEPPGSGTFIDPTITFDSSGAHFGNLFTGDGGRNYIRTLQTDYANVSFTAEVTWTTIDSSSQAAYFGLGSAEPGNFRIADWDTQYSAVHLFMEANLITPEVFTLKNSNGVGVFDQGTPAVGIEDGTHRLRLVYDWFQKKATFSIDLDYAGGPFVADITPASINTLSLYAANGWPSEPARPYFGGDDGGVFKDFQVTVSGSPVILGDFTMDGNITQADWVILRSNQLANLSGKTYSEAYFLGDVTADLANNHADFTKFKELYDAANGVGAFAAMLASVPEPAGLVLIISAAPLVGRRARRATGR